MVSVWIIMIMKKGEKKLGGTVRSEFQLGLPYVLPIIKPFRVHPADVS